MRIIAFLLTHMAVFLIARNPTRTQVWCLAMDSGLSLEQALDELERRLDLLDQKVNLAIEQSLSLLEHVRNRNHLVPGSGRMVTRRIILEETSLVPEAGV